MGVALWPEQKPDTLVPDEVFDVVAGAITPHVAYQTDPIGWASDKMGIPEHTLRWSLNQGYANHQWDGDVDPLAQLFDAVAQWHDVGLESGTGTGKSFGVAVLILWFEACFENALAFTFAPKEDQLRLYIWKNIGELWPRFQRLFPTATLTDLCIRMRGGIDNSWAAHGYAVGIKADETVATKAAGMHAQDMLLVYEEMPGIPAQVVEAGKNTCTAPHNLRVGIGNPNHQLDTLHRFCQESGVVPLRVSALDHPNVVTGNANLIPGAVAQKSIDKRRADYGEQSPVFQSRVRGVSPEQASDSLIRLEWLKAAAKRYELRKLAGTVPTRVTGKGVDVSNSEHGDGAAIVDFADNVFIRVECFPCPDCNALGRQVAKEMDAKSWASDEDTSLSALRVAVDATGVGAGTVNELRRLGKIVRAIHFGQKPMRMVEKAPDGKAVEWSPDVNMFENWRAQAYWQAREDLRLGVVDGPENMELWQELIAPTFDDTSKVVKLEPKDDIKARLGRSPDRADAWVLANWVRARAVKVTALEPREGQSLGYDYKNHRPAVRPSADDEMARMIRRANPHPAAGRMRVPRKPA